MKSLPLICIAGLVAACSATPLPVKDNPIQGFSSVKLGQGLSDARAQLERDHMYYSYTGRTLDYQAEANGEHWFVSAELIKTRVAGIAVTARPQMIGMPLVTIPAAECDRRFERARDALKAEYGSDSADLSPDMITWTIAPRSITLSRHPIENGCDSVAIMYQDYSVPDHF